MRRRPAVETRDHGGLREGLEATTVLREHVMNTSVNGRRQGLDCLPQDSDGVGEGMLLRHRWDYDGR